MKSLDDVIKEIEKINSECKDSPIFDFKELEMIYRAEGENKNKKRKFKNIDELENMAREYIIIHYKAEVYSMLFDEFDYPLDKYTDNNDWDNRNTNAWYAYQELMNIHESLYKIKRKINEYIELEWRK